MPELKKTYLEVKMKARAVHKGLKKPGTKKRQEIYHNLMNQKEHEVYE